MSSISTITSSQTSYLSRLFSKSSQDDESKVNSSQDQSSSTDGLAQLVSCLQQNNAQALSSAEGTDSGSLESSFSGLDSSMMRTLMQGQETQQTSTDTSDMVSAMDTDGDGTVTKEEFLAAKPDDVTDEMASNLWNQLDTEGAGSLSTSDLQTAMESGRMQGPPPPPPSDVASSEETDETTTDSFVSAMDTDGDGIITQEEFLAAKPDDVSTEMATNLWNQLDTEGAGSLSTSDFQTAMESNAPDSSTQMASAMEMPYSGSFGGFDAQMFMEAIESYGTASGYESMGQNNTSVYAMM